MNSNTALALELIHKAKLEHPYRHLVECFIYDAVDSDQAAKYLVSMCSNDPNGLKFSQFVQEWKVLVRQFYIELPRPAHLEEGISVKVMRRDVQRCCIINFLRTREDTPANLYGNHWILSKEVAKFFSQGRVRLESQGSTKYIVEYNSIGRPGPSIFMPMRIFGWKRNLLDHTNTGSASPSEELLEIHSRFSKVLAWIDVALNIKRKAPQRGPRAKTGPTGGTNFKTILSKNVLPHMAQGFPTIRPQTYNILHLAGSCLYGRSISHGVQRLPFNIYIKSGPSDDFDRHTREFTALHLV